MGKTGKKPDDQLKTLELFGIKITGWPLAVLGAIGVALLAFAGNALLEYGKNQTAREAEQVKAAQDAADQYDELDDVARLAGVYIETGKEGSPSDVRKVARLIRSVLTDLKNGRYSAQQVRDNFGGRLQFWATRFLLLSTGLSPVSNQFSENERKTFGLIAADLGQIDGGESDEFQSQSAEAVDSQYSEIETE